MTICWGHMGLCNTPGYICSEEEAQRLWTQLAQMSDHTPLENPTLGSVQRWLWKVCLCTVLLKLGHSNRNPWCLIYWATWDKFLFNSGSSLKFWICPVKFLWMWKCKSMKAFWVVKWACETCWDLQKEDDGWIVLGNRLNQQQTFMLASASGKKIESWTQCEQTKWLSCSGTEG